MTDALRMARSTRKRQERQERRMLQKMPLPMLIKLAGVDSATVLKELAAFENPEAAAEALRFELVGRARRKLAAQ